MDARIKSGHDGCALLIDSIFKQPRRFSCRAVIASERVAMTCNPDTVITGWSAGPDLRCAIAHRGISRFRVRCGACHRAALRADPLASPGMTESGSLPLRNDFKLKSTYEFPFPRRAAPELCIYLPPKRGRGECRMPVAPA